MDVGLCVRDPRAQRHSPPYSVSPTLWPTRERSVAQHALPTRPVCNYNYPRQVVLVGKPPIAQPPVLTHFFRHSTYTQLGLARHLQALPRVPTFGMDKRAYKRAVCPHRNPDLSMSLKPDDSTVRGPYPCGSGSATGIADTTQYPQSHNRVLV